MWQEHEQGSQRQRDWNEVFGDGSGRLVCRWLGVVCASSTHATVGSGRGWLGVVVARQADLSGWLGAIGRCASTGAFYST